MSKVDSNSETKTEERNVEHQVNRLIGSVSNLQMSIAALEERLIPVLRDRMEALGDETQFVCREHEGSSPLANSIEHVVWSIKELDETIHRLLAEIEL